MVLARDKKEGTFYVTTNSEYCISIAGAIINANLWHYQLSHMNENGMKKLCSKGKLSNLKSIDISLCEDYVFKT